MDSDSTMHSSFSDSSDVEKEIKDIEQKLNDFHEKNLIWKISEIQAENERVRKMEIDMIIDKVTKEIVNKQECGNCK